MGFQAKTSMHIYKRRKSLRCPRGEKNSLHDDGKKKWRGKFNSSHFKRGKSGNIRGRIFSRTEKRRLINVKGGLFGHDKKSQVKDDGEKRGLKEVMKNSVGTSEPNAKKVY